MLKKIILSTVLCASAIICSSTAYADTATFTPTDTYNDIWVTLDADLTTKFSHDTTKLIYGVEYCIHWGTFKHCDKRYDTEANNPSKRYIIRFAKKKRDKHPLTVTTKLGSIYNISENSPNSQTSGKVIYHY